MFPPLSTPESIRRRLQVAQEVVGVSVGARHSLIVFLTKNGETDAVPIRRADLDLSCLSGRLMSPRRRVRVIRTGRGEPPLFAAVKFRRPAERQGQTKAVERCLARLSDIDPEDG